MEQQTVKTDVLIPIMHRGKGAVRHIKQHSQADLFNAPAPFPSTLCHVMTILPVSYFE